MPKIRSLFILGILLVFLGAFSGFPPFWRSLFTVIIGVLVSLITFLHFKELKRKYAPREEKKKETELFVENRMDNFSSENK